MPDEPTGTAFGTLYARDGLLVEVLHPAPYARLIAARDRLAAVQGRHVLPVLDVVPEGAAGCAVVRPGIAWTPLTGPLPEAVAVVADVLRALADVHDAGLVHGSLDARAVLLDVSVPLRPTVRVLGHGVAALLTDRPGSPQDDVAAAAELLRQLLPGRAAGLRPVLDELPGLPARAAAARLDGLRAPDRPSRWRRPARHTAAPAPTPFVAEPVPARAGWLPPPVG